VEVDIFSLLRFSTQEVKNYMYARKMRDKFKKLDMWAEYNFWSNRTKQILDEAKQNFYNNI
jgi:hypothetical protein